MRKSNLWIVLILLLVGVTPVMSQEPTLVISEADKKPVITADLSTNLTTFSKTITVTLTGVAGEEAKPLAFTKSDLKEVGGTTVIDRNRVAISAASLQKDKPQDVTITVTNITRPATYTGDITLWVDPNKAAAQLVNLTVIMIPKIDVKVPAPANVQLVRCSPFPCSFTNWLPDRLLGRHRKFTLDNESPIDLPITLNNLLLRGDKSGYLITEQDVTIAIPNQSLGARKSTAIELTLPDTDKLQPDHYVGTLRFGLKGYDTQPTVNYTLDVRDGPWWALGVLVLGVVVGRLVKSMNSPEATTQLKLIRRLYRLHTKASALKNATDRANILAELEAIKERINLAEEAETVLTAEMDRIATRVDLLSKLEHLQTRIALVQDPTLKQELEVKCMSAIQALRAGNIEECLTLIKAIALQLETQPTPEGTTGDSFAGLLEFVRELDEEGTTALAASREATVASPGFFARALAWLSGANVMNAEVRYWLVRPLLFLLLLFLLVMVGLKALYLDAGSSFGSEGLYDYLGLFMWGISAEVTQNALQNLRLPGAPR